MRHAAGTAWPGSAGGTTGALAVRIWACSLTWRPVLAGAAACVVQALEGIAAEYNVPFDKEAAALDMLPGAGRPAPVAAYPVETLAAGAAMHFGDLQITIHITELY